MIRRLALLLLTMAATCMLLLCAPLAHAQGACYHDTAVGKRSDGLLVALPSAQISVFNAGTTTPVTVYSNFTLTTVLGSNGVFNADINGNYHFCATPSQYKVVISSVGFATNTRDGVVIAQVPGTNLLISGDIQFTNTATRTIKFLSGATGGTKHLRILTEDGSTGAGPDVQISAGKGGSGASAGGITLDGGIATTASSQGGRIVITAGTGTGSAGAGGPAALIGGAGFGAANGGAAVLQGGTNFSGTTGNAGGVNVTGGNASAGTGNGGNVTITSGTSAGGTAGAIIHNGLVSAGTAFKTASVTTGSVGAGADAQVTVTFSGVFTTASWTPLCNVLEATTSTSTLRVHHIESITNTTNATVVVRVVNDDGGAPHTGTLYCAGWASR